MTGFHRRDYRNVQVILDRNVKPVRIVKHMAPALAKKGATPSQAAIIPVGFGVKGKACQSIKCTTETMNKTAEGSRDP